MALELFLFSVGGFYDLIHPIPIFCLPHDALPSAQGKKQQINERQTSWSAGVQCGPGERATIWGASHLKHVERCISTGLLVTPFATSKETEGK